MSEKSGIKVVATNRKARHDFVLGERYEAGLALMGSEVKALREGNANLSDSYAQPEKDELWVHNLRIGEYKPATVFGHEPLRRRKLLLHRAELEKIIVRVKERGATIVPTQLYFKGGIAKIEIAIATGKTHEDRREDEKAREAQRDVDRAMRARFVPRGGKRGGGDDYD